MTTSITVAANHGWPVKVCAVSHETGRTISERIVTPNTTETFYVWDGQDLHIHEIQPEELMSDPPGGSGTSDPA